MRPTMGVEHPVYSAPGGDHRAIPPAGTGSVEELVGLGRARQIRHISHTISLSVLAPVGFPVALICLVRRWSQGVRLSPNLFVPNGFFMGRGRTA